MKRRFGQNVAFFGGLGCSGFMVLRPKIAWPIVFASSFVFELGCAGRSASSHSNPSHRAPEKLPSSSESPAGLGPSHAQAEREKLRAAECEAKGGSVVGDIGDGAIHREDYRCENGQAPIATIVADPDGPVATEGSVCCLTAQPSSNE